MKKCFYPLPWPKFLLSGACGANIPHTCANYPGGGGGGCRRQGPRPGDSPVNFRFINNMFTQVVLVLPSWQNLWYPDPLTVRAWGAQ